MFGKPQSCAQNNVDMSAMCRCVASRRMLAFLNICLLQNCGVVVDVDVRYHT